VSRAAVVATLLLAGCASWPLEPAGSELIQRADALVAEGEYTRALAAYDDVIARHPDSRMAARARTTRTALSGVVAAREELAKRQAELSRLAQVLAEREAEVARLSRDLTRASQTLAARQADVARLSAEADRLRAAMDELKRLELELERRR
jgi:hypothetical protein